MFKHLIKLIWNRRKKNSLFLAEIVVSFMVIFILSSFLIFYYQNYRKALGFNYENVWVLRYSNPPELKEIDSLVRYYDQVRNVLKSAPQVKSYSFSGGNFPYSNSISNSNLDYKDKSFTGVNVYSIEGDYPKVMETELVAGRWFTAEDSLNKHKPILITKTLSQEMFGADNPIGKITGKAEKEAEIIGVINDIKSDGDYLPSGNSMFSQLKPGDVKWAGRILIRVSPDADAAFESKLYKLLSNTMKGSSIELSHLYDIRASRNRQTTTPMLIFAIIASFLVFNVSLGLFGVLWYNINQRKGEIGLRRAIGASAFAVNRQLVTEALILTTFSLLIGVFFAIQFPLLKVFDLESSVYFIAIFISCIFIYLLVFICALYPGKQAAAIMPAMALHEE